MNIEQISSIFDVSRPDWNALSAGSYPFVRHEFLAGLEAHDCLESHGWYPSHLLLREGGALLGALPLYIKTNSIGEFVFDWSWADAYERAGGDYYPKLVCAVPYVPSTGARILVNPAAPQPERVRAALIEGALMFAKELGVSSLHWLFTNTEDTQALQNRGLLPRVGCQYHWHNDGYPDFDAFLASLNSKRRKQIRRERREVVDAGIEFEILAGDEVSATQWSVFHDFYCSTFFRRWGEPRLTLPFFKALSRELPERTLLLLARRGRDYLAGAFAMLSDDTLYGRHWGCNRQFRFLHFELCYYQTIEYCITRGLAHIDAGAQGEHKVSRGFVPVRTWSVHWLRDAGFNRAVSGFLARETEMIDDYIASLREHSPYRQAS